MDRKFLIVLHLIQVTWKFARYGTKEQQDKWLSPLLDGQIRSAYAMTEPNVPSSDANNISTTAELKNNEWIINERNFIYLEQVIKDVK